jgi:hypothetical protein
MERELEGVWTQLTVYGLDGLMPKCKDLHHDMEA